MRRPARSRTSPPGSYDQTDTAPAAPAAFPIVREVEAEGCRDLGRALKQDWLITNGLGGYAASTIIGVNTRRYHGLLVAATKPPGARAVLLAKLEETLVIPGARYDLSTNRYPGVVHPEGYRYQERFRMDPWPTFSYRVSGAVIEKSVCLLPQENTTVVSYTLREASGAAELIVRPLVACRDFRWVSQENPTFRTRIEQGPGTVVLHPYEGLPPLILQHGAELFEPAGYWYKSFEYLEEVETEKVHREDLYSPGQFVFLLRPGETAQLIASIGRIPASHWPSLAARATEQRTAALRRASTKLVGSRPLGPMTTRLVAAAEQFLVKGSDGARHVIGGYPWLAAAGREALMALPGLTLATGQPEAAREILQTLASHCRDGLLPVRFTEEDGTPEYDSVDTSLWLFWAVDRYVRATGDLRFIGRRLLDVLMDIVDYYVQGTQFHIVMDQDGLITTDGEELPMTWMDVRWQGQPITLRAGKAIEVNALWYNALMTMADLGEHFRLRLRRQYARLARLVKANAARLFWNPERHTLNDVIGFRQADDTLRPNQLLAMGLPYPLVTKPQAQMALQVIDRELLTPVGVRTLPLGHPAYQGQWVGGQAQRDRARHQGCAWPWWLGPYWSAYMAAYGQTASSVGQLRAALQTFRDTIEQGPSSQFPEFFDGNPPHTPGGASVYSVSVAELLRIIVEYGCSDL